MKNKSKYSTNLDVKTSLEKDLKHFRRMRKKFGLLIKKSEKTIEIIEREIDSKTNKTIKKIEKGINEVEIK